MQMFFQTNKQTEFFGSVNLCKSASNTVLLIHKYGVSTLQSGNLKFPSVFVIPSMCVSWVLHYTYLHCLML